METIVIFSIFFIIVIIGLIAVKQVDAYMEKISVNQNEDMEIRENMIKIACENPVMMSSVSKAIEKEAKKLQDTSFVFYTGSRTDIQKMMKNEIVDIILLMNEAGIDNNENYGEKVSSFVSCSLEEATTGILIEPVNRNRTVMYVLWDKSHITEKHSLLLANI